MYKKKFAACAKLFFLGVVRPVVVKVVFFVVVFNAITV